MPISRQVHALCFDVFGTVVDWRGTLLDECAAFGADRDLATDWPAFIDDWKAGYRPAMDDVNAGRRPWTNVDVIYRERLDQIAAAHGLGSLDDAGRGALIDIWTRSRPWPDSAAALGRLGRPFMTATLSNGNFDWLTRIAKTGGLPFDVILTAENARAYKPDASVYDLAIELLGPRPENVMLVACHNYDLAAARSHGMGTAFLPRKEFGPDQATDQEADGDWDFVATDLADLATQLGC